MPNAVLYGNGTKSFTVTDAGAAGPTTASSTTNVLTLGKNVTVTDTGGNMNYQFAAGDGAVTINNTSSAATAGSPHLDFGRVSSDELWFIKVANNLVVNVLGSKDQVTLTDFYTHAGAESQKSQFEAGEMHLDSRLSVLVQAMAAFGSSHSGFNPAMSGQTSAESSYFGTALASAEKASWHS